jgi:hypothetical protein
VKILIRKRGQAHFRGSGREGIINSVTDAFEQVWAA